MMAVTRTKVMPAAIACLMLAGVLTPIFVLQVVSTPTTSSGQLTSLIGVAQSSKAYADSAVSLASSHGLDVSSAQAKLSQGDSALAQAQADSQSGSNLAAGIQSAELAMQDYTSASAQASIALSNAGLTSSVDYTASEGAVAEVNATASVVAAVEAQACTASTVTTTGLSAFTRACADIVAQLSAAKLQLERAGTILYKNQGSAGGSINFTQVMSFVAAARLDINATQSDLVTIASYGYEQRGSAYVAQVILPLSAEANATIQAEQSALSNLTSFQTTLVAYTKSQSSATSSVASSANTLGSAIAQANGGMSSTVSSISGAQSTESQLQSDLQVLLNLPVISGQASIVADIKTCMSQAASYSGNLSALQSQLKGFSQARLSTYQGYLMTVDTEATSAQSSGFAYSSSFATVVADLQLFATLPQVQAVLGLSVSGTVNAASSSISQQTSAMATVGADISTFSSAVSTSQTSVPVGSSLISTAGTVSHQATVYVNSSAASAITQIVASLQANAQAAQSFVASAAAITQGTIGYYSTNQAQLSSSGTSLSTSTQASVSATATAAAYLSSATQARISGAASGRGEAAQALQFFSSQNLPGGITAMAQAYLDLQAASATA